MQAGRKGQGSRMARWAALWLSLTMQAAHAADVKLETGVDLAERAAADLAAVHGDTPSSARVMLDAAASRGHIHRK